MFHSFNALFEREARSCIMVAWNSKFHVEYRVRGTRVCNVPECELYALYSGTNTSRVGVFLLDVSSGRYV